MLKTDYPLINLYTTSLNSLFSINYNATTACDLRLLPPPPLVSSITTIADTTGLDDATGNDTNNFEL